jgi:hypothetical protein
MMKGTMLMLLFAASALIGLAAPASACGMGVGMCGTMPFVDCDPAAKPAVCAMQPFTVETQYLSMQGYVRWQRWQESAYWLSHRDAVAQSADTTKMCKTFEM